MNPSIITKPKIEIDESLLSQLNTFVQEQGQVIVHCLLPGSSMGTMIRIWPTTFLFDSHSEHRSKLIMAENISYYPIWQEVMPGQAKHFTLVFQGLPKSCTMFDLQEVIPEKNGFQILNIKRNRTDVYFVKI